MNGDSKDTMCSITHRLADMGHDMRMPLSTILTLVSTLHPNDQNDTRVIEQINLNTKLLLRLLGNVVDLASANENKLRFSIDTIDLVSWLHEKAELCKPYTQTKNIEISCVCTVDQAYACVDEVKLDRCVLNLVSNAVKFTPENGIICLTLEVVDGYVRIGVSDSGCGISKQEIDRLFERFYSGIGAPQLRTGNGLGLAIVQAFTQGMGGMIDVQSEPDEGTSFYLSFPREANGKQRAQSARVQCKDMEASIELAHVK